MSQSSKEREKLTASVADLKSKMTNRNPSDLPQITDDGVLSAYLALNAFGDDKRIPSGEKLNFVRQLLESWTRYRMKEMPEGGRSSLGIEVGAGAVKILSKVWLKKDNDRLTGVTVGDVKIQLPRMDERRDSALVYVDSVNAIVLSFIEPGDSPNQGDWIVPRSNFEIALPESLLRGCPSQSGFVYVYGTQGPRVATRLLDSDIFPYMHILSGDEEGLLIYEVIVPEEKKNIAGSVAIEIGSGSTEIVLTGHHKKKFPITFAIGGQVQNGLHHIVGLIGSGELTGEGARYLESNIETAAAFLSAAADFRRGSKTLDRTLYMNPNRDSEAFRKAWKDVEPKTASEGEIIPVEFVLDFRRHHPDDGFSGKAQILGAIAEVMDLDAIHAGNRGGLKEGLALFVESALLTTSSNAD